MCMIRFHVNLAHCGKLHDLKVFCDVLLTHTLQPSEGQFAPGVPKGPGPPPSIAMSRREMAWRSPRPTQRPPAATVSWPGQRASQVKEVYKD